MTDWLSPPIPVGQPVHFAWVFSVAPYKVEFKWDMPLAISPITETVSTWTNGVTVGTTPLLVSDTTTTFHADLVPTSGPGPAYWRVEASDINGVSVAVDEGLLNVAGSPLRS